MNAIFPNTAHGVLPWAGFIRKILTRVFHFISAKQRLKRRPVMDECSHIQFYPVRGYSMRPLIREGDVVKVRIGPGRFRRADVILYHCGSSTLCHRVVCPTDHPSPGYLIQCDPFPGRLVFVSADDVVGRAVAFGRGSRFFSLDRGRYRLFGEAFVFIGLYMRWLPDAMRKVKRIFRKG